MPYCSQCGFEIAEQNVFCPRCGAAAQGATIPASDGGGAAIAAGPATTGLTENTAGLLCYMVGWVTGIIFLITDKRPFVRFHAAQSIAVFGSLFVIVIVVNALILPRGGFGMAALFMLISTLVWMASVFAWAGLMLMAYQGKKYQVPGLEGIVKAIEGNKAA